MLVRKSCNGYGAVFIGLLTDILRPDAHVKFNMSFFKTGSGCTTLLPSPCASPATPVAEALTVCPEAPRLAEQCPSSSHDEPFDGPDFEGGITIPDDLFSDEEVAFV